LQPRALTVIDERIEEVRVFDIAYSDAERVRELIMASEEHATVGPHIERLTEFMHSRSSKGPSIERPSDEREAWAITNKLHWFATEAASDFVRQYRSNNPDMAGRTMIDAVFGFAKSLATGHAFIARNSGGGKATRYIGYENNTVIDPGTLLLD